MCSQFYRHNNKMYKLLCVFLIFFYVSFSDASLTAEQCQEKENKACTIGYGEPTYKPHHKRYIYDWDQQKCRAVLWAYDCKPYPVNNFGTEAECNDNCRGYA